MARDEWKDGSDHRRPFGRMVMETLEPRLLLSADLPLATAHDDPHGLDLAVSIDETHRTLSVLNQSSGAVVESHALDCSPIVLHGTGGDDTFRLNFDASLAANLPLRIEAGGGNDTLIGPQGKLAWSLSKGGAGALQSISFSGFETLRGAEADSLSIAINPADAQNQPVADVAITTGAGNDHLVLKADADPAKLIIAATDGSASVSFYEPTHSLALSTGAGDDSVEVQSLSLSDASLSVNTGDGNDTITLSSISTGGGNLSAVAGPTTPGFGPNDLTRTDVVTVSGGAVISTRDVNARGESIGDSGDITLQGTEIDVGQGAQLRADTHNSKKAGAIAIVADHETVAINFILDALNEAVPRRAIVDIGKGALIDGRDVKIAATAGDVSLSSLTSAYVNGFLIKPLETFTDFINLPISVLLKSSVAQVTIGENAKITASEDLDISATATALANGEGIYWATGDTLLNKGGVAGAWVATDATAEISVAAGAVLSSEGDVTLVSSATTQSTGIARVTQNIGVFPTNPNNVQISVAVTQSNLVSHVTVAEGATLQAGGNAAIRALGRSANSPNAESASYYDGLAGLVGAIGFTNTDVKAVINGAVRVAGGNVATEKTINPFVAVDAQADTIDLGNSQDFHTGDQIVYSSGYGGAIPGLTDGTTYYVVADRNSGKIKLALTEADALAGNAIDLAPIPYFTNAADSRERITVADVDVDGNAIVLGQSGVEVGQQLVYHTAAGQAITGLADGATYRVTSVADGEMKLVGLDGLPVTLGFDPHLTAANGASSAFSIDPQTNEFVFTAAPGFIAGQAVIYDGAFGLAIGGLVSGQTYYIIPAAQPDLDGAADPRRFRLALTQDEALASDGFSNAIDIDVGAGAMSGAAHTLTPTAKAGIEVTAKLTSSDKGVAKSGVGSEPKLRDVINKGELASGWTSILGNFKNLFSGKNANAHNPIEDKIKNNIPKGSGANSTAFTLSGAATYLQSYNTVVAEIGSTAQLQSGRDISVTASLTEKLQEVAEGRVSKASNRGAAFSLGGAATVGITNNDVSAKIDDGARLDARGATKVRASVDYPFVTPLGSPDEFGQALLNRLVADPLRTVGAFVGRTLFLQELFVNSWSRATGKNPNGDVAVAGALEFYDLTNNVEATIGKGAEINQDLAFRTKAQSVSVTAQTAMKMTSVAGIFDIELSPDGLAKARRKGDPFAIYEPFGAQAKQGGLGGAFHYFSIDNTTHALIDSGAKVRAGANGVVDVTASQDILAIALMQSGSNGGTFAVAGAVSYITQDTDTVAEVAAGATIDAASLAVHATDDTIQFSIVGSVFKGKSIGIGGSAAVFETNRATKAIVGDEKGGGSTSDIALDGTLDLSAKTTGTLVALSLASTLPVGSTPSGGRDSITLPNIGQGDEGVGTGSFGLAVSGDASNISAHDVTAAIVNTVGEITAGAVTLTAQNATNLAAAAGAAAVTTDADGSTNIGIAGSYAGVLADGFTGAQIMRATVTAGEATLDAQSIGHAYALAAGGSGAARNNNIAVTGSAAVNKVDIATEAVVEDASITAGTLSLSALDKFQVIAAAGALAYGGRLGFGASVAYNDVESATSALIESSKIRQNGGKLTLVSGFADPTSISPRVVAAAGSAGISTGTAGAAGTAAVNHIGTLLGADAAESAIIDSDYVNPNGDVEISAASSSSVLAVAGAVIAAKNVGVGVGLAYNEIALTTGAFIYGSTVDARSLKLEADGTLDVEAIAGGISVSSATAGAGSAAANRVASTVAAAIVEGAVVNLAQDASLAATDYSTLQAIAGNVAASKNAAAGAAIATNIDLGQRSAYVTGSSVKARSATLAAKGDESVLTVAAGGVGAEKFAAGGSVAVTRFDTAQDAYADRGAKIEATGSVSLAAASTSELIQTFAGAFAGAGTVAVGVSNATLDRKDRTSARIANAEVTAQGRSGAAVRTARAGGLSDISDFRGLSVTAISQDNDQTVAVGGALAYGGFAAAGSASVSLFNEATTAAIGVDAKVDPHSVNVLAAAFTKLDGGGGALAGSPDGGIGAGVDTAKITKHTDASILGSRLAADELVAVQALSGEDVASRAATAGLGGAVGIAGAGSVQVYDLHTAAHIGDGTTPARVETDGNVLVAAADDTELNQFVGALAASINGAFGASAGLSAITKETLAYVGAGSSVTALGRTGGAMMTATGYFDVHWAKPDVDPRRVQPPGFAINLAAQTKDPDAGTVGNENLTARRIATPHYAETRGVAITATNRDDVASASFSGGVGADAAVAVAGAATTLNATTQAYIGDGARVIADGPGTAADASAAVVAASDYHRLGLSGSLGIGGSFGTAPAADVTIVNERTSAKVGAGARVESNRDVTVRAKGGEDIAVIAAGLAASGVFGLDAGAAVVFINNDAATSIGAGANLTANGNMLLSAQDDTRILGSVGMGAIGVTGAGVGASVGFLDVHKATRTEIGASASLAGLARGSGAIAVPSAGSTSPTLSTDQIHGLGIVAASTEDITGIAVAGAIGLYAGVAGGVTVTLVDSNTTVDVDENSRINSTAGAAANQDTHIVAANGVQTRTVGGGFGLGAAALSGGIDVGVVRNDVSIDVAGDVAARNNAKIYGVSVEKLDSFTVSAAAGVVGVAGAVSAWTLGAGFDPTYSDTEHDTNALIINGSSPYTSFITYADAQTTRWDLLNLFGAYKGGGADNTDDVDAIVQAARADYVENQPSNEMLKAQQDHSASGVRVEVESGAEISGDDVVIGAYETIDAAITAGGGGLGLVGAGGSVGIMHAGREVSAQLDGAVSSAALGTVTVEAKTSGDMGIHSYGGGIGLVGIGAQVALLTDRGIVQAELGPDARAPTTGDLTVSATRRYSAFEAVAATGAVGAASAGAAVAQADLGGAVVADVDDAAIGALVNPRVGDVIVRADFGADVSTSATAVAAGIGAGAGNVSKGTSDTKVEARITGDADGVIGISGTLAVEANAGVSVHSVGYGVAAGGIAVAIGDNDGRINDNVRASIDGGGVRISSGALSVTATTDEHVDVTGTANAGVSLIGAISVASTAEIASTTMAYVTDVSRLSTTGNATIRAFNQASSANATATGVNAKGLATGESNANVTVEPKVTAYLSKGDYEIGSDLTLEARIWEPADRPLPDPVGNRSRASASASSGVAVFGDHESATAITTIDTQVRTAIGDPNSVLTPTATTVVARNITAQSIGYTRPSAEVHNSSTSVFYAFGSVAARNHVKDISAMWFGAGVTVASSENLKAQALSNIYSDAYAESQAGGAAANGRADAEISINRSSQLFVGPSASLRAGLAAQFNAATLVSTDASALFESDGVGGNPTATTELHVQPYGSTSDGAALVAFMQGSSVAARTIDVIAFSTPYHNYEFAQSAIKGLAGAVYGKSTIEINGDVLIAANGAHLTGSQAISFNAGVESQLIKANVHEYLGVVGAGATVVSTVKLTGQVGTTMSGSVITTPLFTHAPAINLNGLHADYAVDGSPFKSLDKDVHVDNFVTPVDSVSASQDQDCDGTRRQRHHQHHKRYIDWSHRPHWSRTFGPAQERHSAAPHRPIYWNAPIPIHPHEDTRHGSPAHDRQGNHAVTDRRG